MRIKLDSRVIGEQNQCFHPFFFFFFFFLPEISNPSGYSPLLYESRSSRKPRSKSKLPSRLQEHFNKLNEYKLLVVMVLFMNQSATPGLSQCTPISLQAPCYRILHQWKLLSWRSGKSRRGDVIFFLLTRVGKKTSPKCRVCKKKKKNVENERAFC